MEITINPAQKQEQSSVPSKYAITTPGEMIPANNDFMCGHGTYQEDDKVYSSVYGVVTRINKLLSVRPAKSRYKGEIGDVVVGRISMVDNKRWKVDIHSSQDAVLHLSSIILPGGEQRRRTQSDELQMRKFFVENDLISVYTNFYFIFDN